MDFWVLLQQTQHNLQVRFMHARMLRLQHLPKLYTEHAKHAGISDTEAVAVVRAGLSRRCLASRECSPTCCWITAHGIQHLHATACQSACGCITLHLQVACMSD
jgi:hypothetical protein